MLLFSKHGLFPFTVIWFIFCLLLWPFFNSLILSPCVLATSLHINTNNTSLASSYPCSCQITRLPAPLHNIYWSTTWSCSLGLSRLSPLVAFVFQCIMRVFVQLCFHLQPDQIRKTKSKPFRGDGEEAILWHGLSEGKLETREVSSEGWEIGSEL